jgi:hypothetical protein
MHDALKILLALQTDETHVQVTTSLHRLEVTHLTKGKHVIYVK